MRNYIKKELENHPDFYSGRLSKRNIFRSLTSNQRILPNFIIIGEAKCGTTSLYNYLIQHPNIESALTKEINFFNWSYDKPKNWYKAHFPTSFKQKISEKVLKKQFLTGEATPLYLFHSLVPKRVFQILPKVKLIICLRNPIERAYSHYHDLGVRLGDEQRTFDEAIETEIEILRQKNYNIFDSDYGFSSRLYQYVSRGIYLPHIKLWMETFDKNQVLFVKTEELNNNTSDSVNRVFEFLGTKKFRGINVKERFNVSKYKPMNNSTRNLLKEFFLPYNKELEEYLNIDFNWN